MIVVDFKRLRLTVLIKGIGSDGSGCFFGGGAYGVPTGAWLLEDGLPKSQVTMVTQSLPNTYYHSLAQILHKTYG